MVPPSPTSDETSSRELPIMTPKLDAESCHGGRKANLLWLCIGYLGKILWLLQYLPMWLLVDPGAFPASDSISSSALAPALGRISAGAQWGRESVRAHPQQDPAETRPVRTFLRAVTAAGSWLPPQGPSPLPQVWG